ncbi:MAG: AAA family ATPase [Halanaerobiales bacterium]
MEEVKANQIEEYSNLLVDARKEIEKVIVGHQDLIENIFIAVLCNGNVLLEGVPGLGKTLLVKTLGMVLDLDYSRIQFTPDLMPADIIGTNILMESNEGRRYFEFKEGPIFAQLVLVDEVNRATPKTQSALLEAMQERRITVAGVTRQLKEPFFVLATQNPLEMEGTYPLPEAQVDRFLFKLKVDYPEFDELKEIIKRTTVNKLVDVSTTIDSDQLQRIQYLVRDIPIATEVMEYAVRLVMASQPQGGTESESVKKYVRYGSSPRGAQALILAAKARAFLHNRYNVSYRDIKAVALPSLRHRLLLNFEGEASGVDVDSIITDLVNQLEE